MLVEIFLRLNPKIIDAQVSNINKVHTPAKVRASRKPEKHKSWRIGASSWPQIYLYR